MSGTGTPSRPPPGYPPPQPPPLLPQPHSHSRSNTLPPFQHPHSNQHQPPSLIDHRPPSFEMEEQGLQSFAASPEEWDEGELIRSGSPLVGGPGPKGKIEERKPIATRRRVVQSCSECRRRKIKCDKKFPCGPCILRQDEGKCHEVGMAEKHIVASTTHYATTAELASVAHRLDALEAALIKNGSIIPADIDQYVRSTLSMYPTTDDPSSSTGNHLGIATGSSRRPGAIPEMDNGHNVPPKQDDDTEDAALTIEHLTFGRSGVAGGHSIPYFGARHPSSIGRKEPNNDYHLARTAHSSPSGRDAPPLHPHPGPSSGSPSRVLPLPTKRSSLNVEVKSERDRGREREWERDHQTQNQDQNQSRNQNQTSLQQHEERQQTTKQLGKRFMDTLSYEERMARMDALLDIMEPTDLIDMFWRRTDVGYRYLMKIFPDPEKGRFLVKAFVDKVDWLHRCIHVPSFLRQCNDLWNLPRDRVLDEIAMPFISLYVTVCTLGLTFSDAVDVTKHFDPEQVPTIVDQWYSGVRAAMYASDMMGDHSIEHCQSLLLLSVMMNNRDRSEAAWALLGSTIKMAQNLGMSRLGSEQQAVDGKPLATWTGRWESLVQREVGRRIWWNLVGLEWALAPSYSFCTAITPDQIKTALPANIEDEDLIDGQPLKAKPLNVRTKMSYQLARLRFSELAYKQIWQANNGGNPPYSWILSMDGELRKVMLELPSFFQPSPEDRVPPSPSSNAASMVEYYEKTTLNLSLHSRMMRLHRPWLSRGYSDERFAYSKEQCIRAARAGLRLMCGGENKNVAQFLEKWWVPLFHVSVSAMVVIIDLLRTNKRDMHSSETERKYEEVKGSLDNMRLIKDVSPSAHATVRVMDFLMAEVEDRRRPPNSKSATTTSGNGNGKRKAGSPLDESDDGLQRAVKKLVRQAQLEADSPTGSMPSNSNTNTNANGNGNGNGQNAGSGTPSGDREPISRSSSRERPVFDAYPMPVPLPGNGGQPQFNVIPPGAQDFQSGPDQQRHVFRPNFNPQGGLQPNQSQSQQQPPQQQQMLAPDQSQGQGQGLPFDFNFVPSPYTFPLDPTVNFPPLMPNQGPALDPAVESMLASYFPPPSTSHGQGGGHGGDHGLGGGGGGYDGNGQQALTMPQQMVGPEDFLSRVFSFGWNDPASSMGMDGHGQGQGQGQGPNGGGAHGQNQGQQGGGQGVQGGMGMDGMIGFGGDWGAGSGGWMA